MQGLPDEGVSGCSSLSLMYSSMICPRGKTPDFSLQLTEGGGGAIAFVKIDPSILLVWALYLG